MVGDELEEGGGSVDDDDNLACLDVLQPSDIVEPLPAFVLALIAGEHVLEIFVAKAVLLREGHQLGFTVGHEAQGA